MTACHQIQLAVGIYLPRARLNTHTHTYHLHFAIFHFSIQLWACLTLSEPTLQQSMLDGGNFTSCINSDDDEDARTSSFVKQVSMESCIMCSLCEMDNFFAILVWKCTRYARSIQVPSFVVVANDILSISLCLVFSLVVPLFHCVTKAKLWTKVTIE